MYPTKPTRAVCIMLKEDSVLLMHRVKNNEEYFTFPGGGVEEGETIEEAVVREVLEETQLETEIQKLLYIHHYEQSDQYYYLCKYKSGNPILGNSIEKERMEKDECDVYKPKFVKIMKVKNLLVYPLEIRDWLLKDLESGFDKEPKTLTIEVKNLRQKL
jgi:8-oxo-dGTP diphosphatase